jgi:hypothetical protein
VALVFSQIISYLSQFKLETPKTLSKGVCANKTMMMENVMERQKKESRVAVQLRDTLEVSKFFQVTCAFSGIFLAFKCPVALVFSQIISYLSQSKLETPKTLSKGVCAGW